MNLNEITTDAIMALNPCDDYSRDSVEALLDRHLDTESQVVDLLLELPENDARWFLSRALSVPNRVVWAKACAERARGYATNADGWADAAAQYAEDAANAGYAADAATYADDAAKYADAEHRLAVEHGVRLMGAG